MKTRQIDGDDDSELWPEKGEPVADVMASNEVKEPMLTVILNKILLQEPSQTISAVYYQTRGN